MRHTCVSNSDCVPDFSMRDPTASPVSRRVPAPASGPAWRRPRRVFRGSSLRARGRGSRRLECVHRSTQRHKENRMNAFALLVSLVFFIPVGITVAGQLFTLEEAI